MPTFKSPSPVSSPSSVGIPGTSGTTGASLQWETVSDTMASRSCVMEVFGDTGTGKTRLSLTSPGPIAYFYAHETGKGLVEAEVAKGKEIRRLNFGGVFRGNEVEIAQQARTLLDNLEKEIYNAYTWARTVILETHTELWQLFRYAYFGALKPSAGRVDRNYDPVNARFLSLMNNARQFSETVNTVLVGHTDDEWTRPTEGQGTKTGRTVRATTSKFVERKADVIIRTDYPVLGGSFKFRLEKCWLHASQFLGQEFENPEDDNGELAYGLPDILGMISGTDSNEWKV